MKGFVLTDEQDKKNPISSEDVEIETRVEPEVVADSSKEANVETEDKVSPSVEDEMVVVEDEDGEDEEVLDPEEQIAELEEKVVATHDRLMRTAAELDNVRKRSRRDVKEAASRGHAEVLREILPAIDSLDLALKSSDSEGVEGGIIEGVEMVHRQFLSATERFRLKPIKCVGEIFDPNFHEAVAQISSEEHEAGEIIEEMRKGYLLGERLLRAAMVVVSKGPLEVIEADSEECLEDDSAVVEDEEAEHAVDGDKKLEGEEPTVQGDENE
ncbi:MAG: nucleotide exchange factor GrpE [Deltaproteobacteria bacterium]|nr:nucleotide exchange factor GrpE [Deltaproteobacteria bacterium]